MLTRPRAGVLLTALLAVLLLATACADADRTVARKYRVSDGAGDSSPALRWQSDRYPDFDTRVSDACWAEARVGDAVAHGCVSPLSTILEASPYRRAPSLALGTSLVAIALLVSFALRRVSWRPDIDRTDVPAVPAASGSPATDAIRLMRVVDEEKDSVSDAIDQGRDLSNPAAAGAAGALVLVVVLVALVGYGATLAWGFATAVIILFGAGIAGLVATLPTRFQPANPDPLVRRTIFCTGFAATLVSLTVVGSIGILGNTPLIDLHGLTWLG